MCLLGNNISNSRINVMNFRNKASTQLYSVNVLCAVIHGFVPVWIDRGDVFVCGCVLSSMGFALRGAEFIYS